MVQHHSRGVTISKKQAFKSNDDVHEHCDWTCYLATYPDLSSTCGADTACAEKHFLQWGQSEGRDCTCPEEQSAGAHFDVDAHTSFVSFPFDNVFWQHVPKTAGTSMREALIELVMSRGQKLQYCYNDIRCKDNGRLHFGTLPNSDLLIPFTSSAMMSNQIVFGHGVRKGFESLWRLNGTQAWISTLREPVPLLISAWNHQHRQARFPNFGSSLDEWIEGGNAEAFTDYYASFFIDLDVPDPWDHYMQLPPGALNGISVLAANQSLIDSLAAASHAADRIFLVQSNWELSLDRLSPFLQLTSDERARMAGRLEDQLNVAPEADEEILVKKSNMDRLNRAVEPLSLFYRLVSGGSYSLPTTSHNATHIAISFEDIEGK